MQQNTVIEPCDITLLNIENILVIYLKYKNGNLLCHEGSASFLQSRAASPQSEEPGQHGSLQDVLPQFPARSPK